MLDSALSRRRACLGSAVLALTCHIAPVVGQTPAIASATLFDTGTRGQSVLRARFVEAPRFETIQIAPLGQPALLRDDGRAPDVRAGDGEFAAALAVDFAAEAALFDANRADMQRMGRLPVVVERELRGWLAPSELPARTKTSLPIYPMRRLRNLIDPARSLLIKAVSVVESPAHTWNPCTQTGDPNGIWTFKHLMTQMCNQAVTGIAPEDFVESWVNTWSVAQTINTFTVPARTQTHGQVLANWPRDGNNKLILDAAPFRLQAIVNRVDLRSGGFYGGGTAGELRFVFSLVDCALQDALPFLVIFEYKVPISGCLNVKAWGQQWADLSTHTLGSAAYLNALAAITLQVTEANLAPGRPNGSALGQLRTNEFLDSPWELREFTLPTGNGNLTPSTVAMTPDQSFQFNSASEAALTTWLNARAPGPFIPLSTTGTGPLRGGNAMAFGPGWRWDPPTNTFDRRFKFSLNTCNACHAGETETFHNALGFRHVFESFFGSEAQLSAFLQGDPANATDNFWHDVTDPFSGVEHLFFDLEVRRLHLDALLASSCLADAVFAALASPH